MLNGDYMKKVIKKTKEKMKNNKELLLGLIVGLLISSAGVYAVEGYLYESDEVSYNDSKVNTVTLGADTVQGALDELNTRIEANCMKKTVTVQVVNGSVTGESTKQIKTGTQGSFTVSSDIGYGNGTVSCTNSQTATLSGNTLTITPTSDTTCTVTYQINTYTVTVAVTNGTGAISATVNYGATGTFTVSPNSGYGNGIVSCTNSQTATLSGTTLTTGSITQDTTCTVTFTATASWHYGNDFFFNANECRDNCKSICSSNYGTSVWSCTASRSTAPASASLTSGRYCWCQY